MHPDSDDVDFDAYDERMDAIRERVESAFPDGLIEFSASPEDDDGLPLDVLDDVAADGPVVFTAKSDPFFGVGKDFVSSALHSPKWLDVVAVANEAVRCTGDEHHVYLEGIRDTGGLLDGCKVFALQFGS